MKRRIKKNDNSGLICKSFHRRGQAAEQYNREVKLPSSSIELLQISYELLNEYRI
nr:hypothetical protein [Rickettsia endosymbiont of Ceutorhynchus assimilis]